MIDNINETIKIISGLVGIIGAALKLRSESKKTGSNFIDEFKATNEILDVISKKSSVSKILYNSGLRALIGVDGYSELEMEGFAKLSHPSMYAKLYLQTGDFLKCVKKYNYIEFKYANCCETSRQRYFRDKMQLFFYLIFASLAIIPLIFWESYLKFTSGSVVTVIVNTLACSIFASLFLRSNIQLMKAVRFMEILNREKNNEERESIERGSDVKKKNILSIFSIISIWIAIISAVTLIISSAFLITKFLRIFCAKDWSNSASDWYNLSQVYNGFLAIPLTAGVAIIAILTLKKQGQEFNRKRIEDFSDSMINNHRSLINAVVIPEYESRSAITYIGKRFYLEAVLQTLQKNTKSAIANGELFISPHMVSVMIRYAKHNPDQNFIEDFKEVSEERSYKNSVRILKAKWPTMRESAKLYLLNSIFSDREIANYYRASHEICSTLYAKCTDKQKEDFFNKIYHLIYDRFGSEIGPIFRNMYYFLQEIDEYNDYETSKRLAKIFRAQLSRFELVLLYLNFMSDYCKPPFKSLISKYDMLDGIHNRDLLVL